MNNKAFFNILLSTAITLLIVSAFFFYLFSHPKESASSAYAIGEKAAHVIAETSKESQHPANQSNITTSQNTEAATKKESKESISIVGRTIQDN